MWRVYRTPVLKTKNTSRRCTMPPARVKVAPGWECRVLVMVLITDGLYLDSWDENYSSKSTQWVGVMNALSQPPLIALFLDLLWLDKPKPSSQRRGWLGGQELEPHLLTQVLLSKTYNPQLYKEGTKKKAVIYGRTTGNRVSGTRKISRTRKATSMWTVKTKLHQLLRWNQSNSLCVGGSPGPSSLDPSKAHFRSFKASYPISSSWGGPQMPTECFMGRRYLECLWQMNDNQMLFKWIRSFEVDLQGRGRCRGGRSESQLRTSSLKQHRSMETSHKPHMQF